MANKMLIDAAHPEETRVVVLRGNRVEEFDFESANRRQLRGNIYLAKVTRVEPSLQAAFVDYGGNRHGFLAFSEIHPDYYQIPVADRQALIAEEERAHRAAEAEHESRAERSRGRGRGRGARRAQEVVRSAPVEAPVEEAQAGEDISDARLVEAQAEEVATEVLISPSAGELALGENPASESAPADSGLSSIEDDHSDHEAAGDDEHEPGDEQHEPGDEHHELGDEQHDEQHEASAEDAAAHEVDEAHDDGEAADEASDGEGEPAAEEEDVVESVGGADAMEEVAERAPRLRRQYKIQEVIKRRQIMLVQVVKEERGTKGAALTTYLSLAGRYSVLMPNTARGGGISRKITSAQDRSRLKEVASALEVPEGMGVILRTAGAARTPTEIKRDFEYLLRVWENVRDLTLKSTAPTLVYEEGSLVKRAIRDLYNKDIDEVLVAGEAAYREAKDFMRMLMPTHAKNVKLYHETTPMFSRFGIESQLDAMFSPVVTLRSGGYIVLNQTEALVSIDVNSGRATREHHIEDTALKTNIEAAEEIARQLRLRDLAGLVVIDFIDMDENRNNRAVERRLKDALKNDRARIQVGRISHFGLLEMSRQRIRTSVLESSTDKCPHCGGSGHVRSVASLSLQLLRVIEETLLRGATHDLIVRTNNEVALYILNHKRGHLRDLESRFRITITVTADATMGGQQPFLVEKGEQVHSPEQARAIAAEPFGVAPAIAEEEEPEGEALEEPLEGEEPVEGEAALETDEETAEEPREGGRRRRRRRRRGGARQGEQAAPAEHEAAEEAAGEAEETGAETEGEEHPEQSGGPEGAEAPRRRRRRGRRGGRRNRRGEEQATTSDEESEGSEANGYADESGAAAEPARADEIEEAHDHEAGVEPEVATAVADFGGPPRELTESPAQDTPTPSAASRRRSTVRERVSLENLTSAPSPAPSPVSSAERPVAAAPDGESEAAGEQTDRPRRTGWWAKRLLGDRG